MTVSQVLGIGPVGLALDSDSAEVSAYLAMRYGKYFRPMANSSARRLI